MPVLLLAFAQRGLLSVFALASADLASVVAVNPLNVDDRRYPHSSPKTVGNDGSLSGSHAESRGN